MQGKRGMGRGIGPDCGYRASCRWVPGMGLGSLALMLGFPLILGAQEVLPTLGQPDPPRVIATQELRPPAAMAVLSDNLGTRLLVGLGEPIFQAGDPAALGVITDIRPDALTVRVPGKTGPIRVRRGGKIGTRGGLTYEASVLIQAIQYRTRTVSGPEKQSAGGEWSLVEVQAGRAVLQRDVLPPPSPTQALEERIRNVRLVAVAPYTWELSSADVRTAMESGEAVAVQALGEGNIGFSVGPGLEPEIKTPLANVRLGSQGLLITDPMLAQRAGLRVGDRILAVNDQPIQGMSGLVQAYIAVKRTPNLSSVRVLIERQGLPLTLTFRVR